MTSATLNCMTYETYIEIMNDLSKPIESHGLDIITLKRLYESKLVYLENLRDKVFLLLNDPAIETLFSWSDYEYIIQAKDRTIEHLRSSLLISISESLSKKSA